MASASTGSRPSAQGASRSQSTGGTCVRCLGADRNRCRSGPEGDAQPGTNNLLQVLRRVAHGFTNPDNFAARGISDETTAAIADCVDAKQWLERLLTPGVGDETASCVAEAIPPDVAFDVAVSPFLTGAEIVSASQAAYNQALELCGLS